MTGKQVWLAIVGFVAMIAAGLGVKWGQRKADQRVESVANEGAEIMKGKISDRLEEELAEISGRPDGGNADWVAEQLRKRAGLGGASGEEPEG